ncbi:MAG: hypothetical protein Q4D11_04110 [Rhodospirillales bacterium]|nr:hypothetical protein [Rhodospirillales bacterium]
MKKFCWVFLLLLVAGCASQEKYAQMLSNYVGFDEEELISRMGPPDSVYELNKSTKYLTYKRAQNYYNPPSATTHFWGNTAYTDFHGGYEQRLWCNTTFTMKSGRVTDYRFEGNNCLAK